MAAQYISGTQAASAVLYGRIGRFISNAIITVADWNDARVTRNALSRLTDRELDDIGLCRGDIDDVTAR
ncbi:hypothetical protein ATO6_00580 [Oceanicola sp. 22II-s10i]|uniref:DUF1127 domain-containing protein n=1 Tax=Oceanicola sp. 22II-s10i TaxID=1317116 RepID=UPI000B520036|nr:DUF1127 domain-containing protein [Oceanicola sp. 22II-s10i]OWU85484.1 hypothetical protein ATO6_00580 [Oceanicola sp. 22II-s10i]